MRCGNCRQDHETVTQVRACYGTDVGRPNSRPGQYPDQLTNRFAGTCRSCRGQVLPETGHIEKVDGKWAVFHNPGDCVSKRVTPQQVRATAERWAKIPQGHYATASLTGHNDLDFWRVDRPDKGKWTGGLFVKRVIGGRPSVP